jgi:hypothetical protein
MNQSKQNGVLVITPMELRHKLFLKTLIDENVIISAIVVGRVTKKALFSSFFSLSGVLHVILTVYELICSGPIKIKGIPIFYVTSLAEKQITDVARFYNPSLIIVYGGKIIPKATLRSFLSPCINVHGSILPGYRGLDSYWWALVERKRHLMGYSIHHVDENIDTGNLLFIRQYSPSGNLLIRHLAWRVWVAKNSARKISELIKKGTIESSGVPHCRAESVYRSKITFWNFLKLRIKFPFL